MFVRDFPPFYTPCAQTKAVEDFRKDMLTALAPVMASKTNGYFFDTCVVHTGGLTLGSVRMWVDEVVNLILKHRQ